MGLRRLFGLVGVGLIVLYFFLLSVEYSKFQRFLGDPWGRAVYVKLHNPDIAPGTPHILALVNFAKQHGYSKILVIHNAGKIGYSHFWYRGILIIQLGWYDYRTVFAQPELWLVMEDVLYGQRPMLGIWIADRREFRSMHEAINHVRDLESAVPGRTMVVWHGSCRNGNPLWNLGCGAEPYFWILSAYGGRVLALTLAALGNFAPIVFYGDAALAELRNYDKLQALYNSGTLNRYAVDPYLRKKPMPMGPRGVYD
ncbi:hypothetical protein [Methanopyrus sp. SNP6]|uniref:hypothetical protein n=1 Tax=Methanopyrus sp. SNP6 TaxID=1937005 RepID=UPI0011E5D76B|nr:hypothetical protein [Methanopyrus sp. SNP6]